MKNVLITGGAGFVGFNLCKELLKKEYIIFLDQMMMKIFYMLKIIKIQHL